MSCISRSTLDTFIVYIRDCAGESEHSSGALVEGAASHEMVSEVKVSDEMVSYKTAVAG